MIFRSGLGERGSSKVFDRFAAQTDSTDYCKYIDKLNNMPPELFFTLLINNYGKRHFIFLRRAES
jgi:hypothetical protein